MKPMRVLLAEDHTMVRAGIRELLLKLGYVDVVAEAGNGREALEQIREHRPDVVLMDITMPDLNGLEVLQRVRKEMPAIHVVILSMHTSEEYVLQALQAGASGYMVKDGGTEELDIALKAVGRGETYLCPQVSKHVVSDYVRRVGAHRSVFQVLTRRQRELLQLIAEGCTTKEIAFKLKISVKTAETLRMQMMKRLDIHHIAGLVRYAIRTGLVTADK